MNESVADVPSMDNRRLRDALGRFGTGVAVVTALRSSFPSAVTVNSFASLSLDPPLIAFCLGERARCLPYFRDSASLAINVLGHGQRQVAANFARPGSARWDGMPLERTSSGYLIVRGALAAFECAREQYLPVGDHVMFTLRVRRVHLGRLGPPLLFFASDYGSFLPNRATPDTFDGGGVALGWG